MTAINPEIPDWEAVIERRLDERRKEDRERSKLTLSLIGAIMIVGTALVAVTSSWVTASTANAQKVNIVDQIKTDAGFDTRINVNTMHMDMYMEGQHHMQASIDLMNQRLTQVLCDGKPKSCR